MKSMEMEPSIGSSPTFGSQEIGVAEYVNILSFACHMTEFCLQCKGEQGICNLSGVCLLFSASCSSFDLNFF